MLPDASLVDILSLVFAVVALGLSLLSLRAVLSTTDWCCHHCGRFRPRKDAEGWRHCDQCEARWKTIPYD